MTCEHLDILFRFWSRSVFAGKEGLMFCHKTCVAHLVVDKLRRAFSTFA